MTNDNYNSRLGILKGMVDSRERQLTELKSFTDTVNRKITDIVGALSWTVKSVTDVDKEYLTCSYDSSHRITERSLSDHLASCQWKAEGYSKSDVPLSESTLSSDSPFGIKFDAKLQNEVLRRAKERDPTLQIGVDERLIPHTSDRLLADFTSDERKTLYDYAIANTAKSEIGQDIADINDLKPQERDNKELSFLELLVQERNLKRRRAKHRGVHTNKKSHVEILREVINQQMEIYSDYISGQTNSEHATEVPSVKTEDLSCEIIQERTERFYEVTSPQDYEDFRENNGHRYSKRDKLKRKHSEERSRHRSRDREKQERYADEHDERYKKHSYSEHKKSSYSRDRKSHKKNKHRSKDKHHEKKHKSRDRDKSSERHHSRHNDDHRRKGKK